MAGLPEAQGKLGTQIKRTRRYFERDDGVSESPVKEVESVKKGKEADIKTNKEFTRRDGE